MHCFKERKMEIKVLGTGCANCKNTYALIERSAKDAGVSIRLVKVEAIEEIMQYGVASTPAVVIDGVVVHSGGVPSTHSVRKWLTEGKSAESSCCSGSACCEPEAIKPVASSSCSTGSCGTDVGAKNGMGVGALINLMAGSMVLLGLLLAHLSGTVDMTSASWLWLPAFVGLNLIQFAFTGFCPAKRIFEKMGVKQSCC
jgi:small redox-active disulfide protein 2